MYVYIEVFGLCHYCGCKTHTESFGVSSSSFVKKTKRTKKLFDDLADRRKKESKHSFWEESTIWQWLKAEGTKN